MSRLRVGVFAGGRSAEHEVSVASAEAVLRAIDRERFEPYLVYIDRDGRWLLPDGPAPALDDGQSLAGLVGAASPADEAETRRLHLEVAQLRERLAVLERITVEKENSLAREIEQLRDR